MVEQQMTEKEGREMDPSYVPEKSKANVVKRSFSYSLKKTKDYNSVNVSEGFEMELPDGDLTMADIDAFDLNKKLIIERVNKQVEEQLWVNTTAKLDMLQKKEENVKQNLKLIL